jgi:hypothetical protein
MTCKPKKEGSLGVINIENRNKALLLKNMRRFFNGAETPWVQLVWKKTLSKWKTTKQHKKPAEFQTDGNSGNQQWGDILILKIIWEVRT